MTPAGLFNLQMIHSIASILLHWLSVSVTVFQREGVKAGVTVKAHTRVPCPEEPRKCWGRVLTILSMLYKLEIFQERFLDVKS